VSLWADRGGSPTRFGPDHGGTARVEAIERVKDWTRERFGLQGDEIVVVTEGAPTLPGFPPRMTGVAFWAADGTRYHYRVYKGAEGVVESDLPPSWMKASLAWDGFDCDCC
jgi:hypothetical protein